jgi:hypothetical protein
VRAYQVRTVLQHDLLEHLSSKYHPSTNATLASEETPSVVSRPVVDVCAMLLVGQIA